MKIEIHIDPEATEPRAILYTSQITPEIEALARNIENHTCHRLTAYSERGAEIIRIDQALRIYTESQQIRLQTLSGQHFSLRGRLYEYEQRLSPCRFVRISNSEIVNGDMITGMDFSLTGTIGLYLKGNVKTYVSRRYVSRIKKLFDV